ncbi:MAG: MBL fold metallo-hydrolase [Clostridia bacterium]|nr:MBL fold metallo-hydrolase [Clostridia bacterium]
MERSLVLTYFYHSGCTVRSNDTLLVFDYWRGQSDQLKFFGLTTDELKKYKQVIVFVSHDHPDHLDEVIYQWDKPGVDITYVISWDLPSRMRGKRMHVGDRIQIGDAVITAYDSTDKGVSFYVEIDGCRIFHAGDLNLWHWREENSLHEITQAEKSFYAKMKDVEKLNIDLAMFPVDPRMGGFFDAGANYFIMSVKPRLFIPIHWFDRKEAAKEFARKARTRYTEVIALTEPRDALKVQFEDDSIIWRVLPKEGAKSSSDDVLDKFKAEDPFVDSDLPIRLDPEKETK